MRAILFLAAPFFLAAAAQAAPSGWRATLSRDGKCAAMVPGNWGVVGQGMQAPRGHSHVRAIFRSGAMADEKGLVTNMFAIKTTFEDSAGHYWVELGGLASGTLRQWHVAVPGDGGVCIAEIAFDKSFSEAGAKTVALSLRGQ